MSGPLDWRTWRDENAARLLRQTGRDVTAWNARIAQAGLADVQALRDWLKAEGVTGYSAQLLRWERFGYPDFITATAGELVDAQYVDRPALRPVYDAIVEAALDLGAVVQARKGYVSLLTPRRTFARVQASTRTRIDIGLRLEGQAPGGRLATSRINETMPVQLSLSSADDLDEAALGWLRAAYDENA